MNQSSKQPISESGAKLFKVAFDLALERPDWPPVSVERLWGEKTEVKFEIRLVNTPLFVRGIAYGDLIAVRPDNERRELVFDHLKSESGHSTIRIVFLQRDKRVTVEGKLRAAGCTWTSARGFGNLLAVDIPPEVNYVNLREWLLLQVESEVIEVQEGSISASHRLPLRDFP
jgi:hypothetical protein